jgi:hypothetical protein
MDEPQTVGESKKKGIALMAIGTLAALANDENTLYIIGAITFISVVGMSWHGALDWMKQKIKLPKP